MAKKTVATLQKQENQKKITKLISCVKSPKTGSYQFKVKFLKAEDLDRELNGENNVI